MTIFFGGIYRGASNLWQRVRSLTPTQVAIGVAGLAIIMSILEAIQLANEEKRCPGECNRLLDSLLSIWRSRYWPFSTSPAGDVFSYTRALLKEMTAYCRTMPEDIRDANGTLITWDRHRSAVCINLRSIIPQEMSSDLIDTCLDLGRRGCSR